MVVAAGLALVAVVLQVVGHGSWHTVGVALSWAVWVVFLLDAAVLLAVHPRPGRWARGHWFELVVLVVAFPLWPQVIPRVTEAEILPALDLLKAAKLAKLAKAVRLVRHRSASRGLVVAVVLIAIAVAVLVVATGH